VHVCFDISTLKSICKKMSSIDMTIKIPNILKKINFHRYLEYLIVEGILDVDN